MHALKLEAVPAPIEVEPLADVSGISVLLVAEGTYPFHFGGVSTWCDGLISCMPDVPFHLVTISDRPNPAPIFALAGNVLSHENRAAWGARFAADHRVPLLRRLGLRSSSVETTFLPAYETFVRQIFGRDFDPEACATAIHAMHRYFVDYGFESAMRSMPVWETSHALLAELLGHLDADVEFGATDLDVSVGDIATVTMWLRHWLLVIADPLPRTSVVHTAMVGLCTLVAVAAQREHGARFMSTEHGVYLREVYLAESKMDNDVLKLVRIRWASRITQLSYAAAEQISPCCDFNQRWEIHQGADPAKLRTIYYGMDPSNYEPRERLRSADFTVTWMGRINPLKDVETLLRAAALVCAEHPNATFNLYGSAGEDDLDYEATCRALWHELEIEGRVHFRGFTNRPLDAINAADVIVLPSISEGFPNCTLEAMLCGRPVVVTAVGGLPEQIGGTGIVVPPKNPERLAEAIGALIEDEPMREHLGAIARERAVERFTVARLRSEHLRSYARLIGGFGAAPGIGRQAGETTIRVLPRSGPLALPAARRLVVVPDDDNDRDNDRGDDRGDDRDNDPGNGMQRPQALVRSAQVAVAAGDHDIATQRLASWVESRNLEPADALELAAVFESQGLTDLQAREQFGVDDVFAVARLVRAELAQRTRGHEWWTRPKTHRARPDRKGIETVKEAPLWTGLALLVASAVVIILIQLARAAGDWTAGQTLGVHAGVALGMATANGLVLAMSRPTSYYLASNDMRRLRSSYRHAIGAWAATAAVTAVLMLASLRLAHLASADVAMMIAAFVIASALVLLLGAATLLRAGRSVALPVVAGVAGAILVDRALRTATSFHLAIAASAGTIVAVTGLMVAIGRHVRQLNPNDKQRSEPRQRSRVSASTMRDAIPYFAAGLLGSLVLIAPHLVAWAEPHRGRHWRSLDNALELGLTVSLIPLIESIALSTRAQRRFWRRFPVVLDTTSARTAREAGQSLVAFVNRLRKDYLTTLATLSALAFVVYGAFVGIGIVRPAGRGHQWYDVAFFGCGLVAALLYGAGSFGCMYALSLGRPRPVVAAVALALVSVPAVGWPLALAWPFPAALVSSLVSSAVYAVLAQRACRIAILDSARLNSIFS